jgi:hypothetical protein
MRKTSARRTGLALATAMAVALTGLTTSAAEALAPGLDPADRLGAITFDVSSGEISGTGSPQRLTTETGCPEGYRRSSRVLFVWADGTVATWSPNHTPALVHADDGVGSGLDGAAIDRRNASPASTSGRFAARWNTTGFTGQNFDGRSGVASYVITCDPGQAPDGDFPPYAEGVGDSKYFSTDVRLEWNDGGFAGTGTWEAIPDGPIEKVDTTTTLTGAALNDGRVRLTATVAPSVASGTVTFKSGDGSTIATENLAGGSAETVVGDLEPDNEYTFTAQYAGDVSH